MTRVDRWVTGNIVRAADRILERLGCEAEGKRGRVKGEFDRLWEGWFVRKEAILLCARIEPQSQEEEDESLATSA